MARRGGGRSGARGGALRHRSAPFLVCLRPPGERVLLGRGVALGAGDRDDVQRVVELAVPAAVQPVLGALTGGAWDRGGSGLQPEARVFAEMLEPGGVADQDRRGQRPAPLLGQQLGAVSVDELAKLCFELIDLTVEAAELGDLLVRDPDPGAGRQLPQPPSTRSSSRALLSAPRFRERSSSGHR